MKNTFVRGLALSLFTLSMATMFAKMTQEELIESRKNAMKEWEKTLVALKQAGYSEKDPVYQRVLTAFKKNQTRAGNLEKERTLEKGKRVSGKIGEAVSTTTKSTDEGIFEKGKRALGKIGEAVSTTTPSKDTESSQRARPARRAKPVRRAKKGEKIGEAVSTTKPKSTTKEKEEAEKAKRKRKK